MRKFFGPMGSVSRLSVESQVLKTNVLDDPSMRIADLYELLPPALDRVLRTGECTQDGRHVRQISEFEAHIRRSDRPQPTRYRNAAAPSGSATPEALLDGRQHLGSGDSSHAPTEAELMY